MVELKFYSTSFFQKNVHHIGLKYINQSQWKNTVQDNVQGQGHWKNTGLEHGVSDVQWKSTKLEDIFDKNSVGSEVDSAGIEDFLYLSHPTKESFHNSSPVTENFLDGSVEHVCLDMADNKEAVSPVANLQRSKSTSCDTLDSFDSGLESSESLLNPEHSSSRDSLDTVDHLSCFPRKGPLKYKLDHMTPGGNSYSPVTETASPLDSPLPTDGDASPTLLSFRKRSSVTEVSSSQSLVFNKCRFFSSLFGKTSFCT